MTRQRVWVKKADSRECWRRPERPSSRSGVNGAGTKARTKRLSRGGDLLPYRRSTLHTILTGVNNTNHYQRIDVDSLIVHPIVFGLATKYRRASACSQPACAYVRTISVSGGAGELTIAYFDGEGALDLVEIPEFGFAHQRYRHPLFTRPGRAPYPVHVRLRVLGQVVVDDV